MKKAFPLNNIILTPDIVLSLSLDDISTKRSGVLLCLRNDPEGVINA